MYFVDFRRLTWTLDTMPVTVSALANMLLISNTLNHHVGDRNSSTVHCRACSFHATRQRGHCITESWKTHQPPGFGNSGGFPLSGNKQPDRQALSPHNYSPFGHISVGAAIRFQCGTQFPNTFPTSPFFTDAFLTNKPCIKISPSSNASLLQLARALGMWCDASNGRRRGVKRVGLPEWGMMI